MAKEYINGKIYIIRCVSDTDLIYIGSTCKPLEERMREHIYNLNYYKCRHLKLYEAMREIGREHFYMDLVEKFECENKTQLTDREGYFIKKYNARLNRNIEGRTIKEWYVDNKEKIKEYYEVSKDKIKEYYEVGKDKIKEYYGADKDKIKTRKKPYYEANKEEFNARRKEYYEANKDKIKEYYEQNKDEALANYEQNKVMIRARRQELYKLKKQQLSNNADITQQQI